LATGGGARVAEDYRANTIAIDYSGAEQKPAPGGGPAATLHCFRERRYRAHAHRRGGQNTRQIVIEAPTFNKTNEPFGNPFVLVPNRAIAGRNLEYYRYDGQGIHGSSEELIRLMASVRPDAVFEALTKALNS